MSVINLSPTPTEALEWIRQETLRDDIDERRIVDRCNLTAQLALNETRNQGGLLRATLERVCLLLEEN